MTTLRSTLRSILVAFLTLASVPADALAGHEFQLWTEAGVRWKFARKFRLQFDQHLRLGDDATRVDSVMPQVAVSWRAFKFLRLEAGYRYTAEPYPSNQEGTFVDSWHRFFVDAELRWTREPVTVGYRLCFEEEFGWPWNDAPERVAKHTVRNRIGAELDSGFGPKASLSAELFNRIDDPDGAWHKWRVTAGVEYRLDAHGFSLFYRLEDFLDKPDQATHHILGIAYHFFF